MALNKYSLGKTFAGRHGEFERLNKRQRPNISTLIPKQLLIAMVAARNVVHSLDFAAAWKETFDPFGEGRLTSLRRYSIPLYGGRLHLHLRVQELGCLGKPLTLEETRRHN